MQTPLFVDGQFVDGTLLNGAVAQLMNNFEVVGSELHTPGVLNPSSLTFAATTLLNVTVTTPSPFAVLFATGLVVGGNQTVSGAVSSSYSVNFAPLVPTSGGAVTAYIVAGYGTIGEQQTQVIGPPDGHPDYDPTFAPFQWYLEGLDTLTVGVTTTAPNNLTTFEIARTSLTVGQTTINNTQIVSGANWHYASAVLNPTGVTPGSYQGATVTVGADGRISAVSQVLYGPLASNNAWTGANHFSQPITVVDTGSGGLIVDGTGNGSTGGGIKIIGNGATTPNKFMRVLNGVLQFLNSANSTVIMTLNDSGNVGFAGTINSTGDIVANAGHVRAASGAFNSGDSTIATLLGDFTSNPAASNPAYSRLPNGVVRQCGINVSTSWSGINGGTINFAAPFASHIQSIVVSEGGAGTWVTGNATMYSAINRTLTGFDIAALYWNGSGWVGPGPGTSLGFEWIAEGV